MASVKSSLPSVNVCSECGDTGLVQDPFGAPGEMMSCQCRDAAEVERVPFTMGEFEGLLGALDRAADEHKANAPTSDCREWEEGVAFAYKCIADLLRDKAGMSERQMDQHREEVGRED